MGDKHARELLLSGRILDAAEAFRLGLVTEIVPTETLMARAREIAVELIASSPVSLARTKLLLVRAEEASMKAELEMATRENADIRTTADFQEGLASFLEKRPPKWTDR